MSVGDYNNAEQYIKSLQKFGPKRSDFYYKSGEFYHNKKEYIKAITNFSNAISLLNKPEKKDWYLQLDYLSSWYESLKNVEEKINNIKNLPFYVIWGGGAHTEFLYQTTSFFHSKTESKFLIVDSDELKHGKSWRGIKIYDTSILKDLDWKDKGLIISSYGSQNQIKKIALDTGISKEHLVCLYENITRY